LKVDTQSFVDMVKYMGMIKILDISNCRLLDEEAIIKLVETNKAIVQFKASGCRNAITDKAMQALVNGSRTEFEIMDISYCANLTDEGLKVFAEKSITQHFVELHLNGLAGVTNLGFSSLLSTCSKSLVLLNMSLNDQTGVTGEVCKAIGKLFELEILDLTGCKNIGDDGLNHLVTGSIPGEERPIIIGLKNLAILKLNSLDMLNDGSLVRLLKMSNKITHLEVSTCSNLTEYFFVQLGTAAPQLEFIDMNMIDSMTPKIFDEFRENNPKLNIRRFMHQAADVKDNGLRRPLKIKGGKTKKKKKKGKKKKK
jgi:hypothetical protein